MIGFFDSGLGGLTVLRRVRALLPRHDAVFLADQKHVPYGDRDDADLHRLLSANLAWLDAQGCDVVAMACNTSCAVAQSLGWPTSRALVLDLIESAAIAVSDAGFERVGVIATSATVRSGAYTTTLGRHAPHVRVHEVAAPTLVPLVEAGLVDSPEARSAVAAACAELPSDIDAVILACTHFPYLDAHFAASLGPSVARIDPAYEQAGRTAAVVASRGVQPGNGTLRTETTGDDRTALDRAVHALLGE